MKPKRKAASSSCPLRINKAETAAVTIAITSVALVSRPFVEGGVAVGFLPFRPSGVK